MSKSEILSELPRLTREERYEIRVKLAEMDSDEWLDEDAPLSVEDKALIEARMEAHEKNPGTALSWEDFDARLRRRLGE
jgi:putative addiction module component (TIGR02574 family)